MRFQVALRVIAANKVRIALALFAVVLMTTSMVTFGSWSVSGSGSGYSKAVSVPQSATPTKAIATWPNIAVSWTATTVGSTTADSYLIRRYTEAGVLQTILANCSGAIAALTCTENTVPVGRWQYSTQAQKGTNWLGSESAKSTTVAIVAAPTVLACTSCATFGGIQKYINLAGKDAVTVTVTLAASSLASDTVNLSLTDTVPTAVSNNTAAPAGAGTITPAAQTTTTLIDGVVVARAVSTANTSDPSPATTLSLIRDIVVPTAANIKGNNGNVAGTVDAGDTVVYTFSEAPDPASIKAGWNGTSTAVSAVFSDASSADTLVISGTNLGTVNTAADYVKGTKSCTASTMVLSGSVITVTFATCDAMKTGVGSSAFIWTPLAAAKDQAQNPMSTTARTATTGVTANF